MEQVYIFDTTLRDGEQSPGASMSMNEKLEIAFQLERMGVDVIEAGFPISSPHQFDSCCKIAENIKNSGVAVLARSVNKDLDAAYEAVKAAARPRIHTFIASSPIHMKHKLKKNPDQVLEMATSAVKYARNLVPEVEFSPEDATRSDLDFLYRLIEAVIDAGARIINIPDTVGYALPSEFGSFIASIKDKVPNIDKAIISVHCHNDLGLAVANSLAAIENGARQIEVTVNGIGERSGNAALEELVMSFYVRRDRLPYKCNIDNKQLYNSSRLLYNIIAFPIPRNKPIVGENAFAHESGIHQDGFLKHRETYEIMTPESVGRESSKIVLGRHSGMHGFKTRVLDLGFKLSEEDLQLCFSRFMSLADRKKEVFDEDIYAIITDELGHKTDILHLDFLFFQSGNKSEPKAQVKILKGASLLEAEAKGDGPVDAVFKAIDKALKVKTKLENYHVNAVTPGKEALGEVAVSLFIEEIKCIGRGSSTDIIEASAKAYIAAVNRFLTLQNSNNNG